MGARRNVDAAELMAPLSNMSEVSTVGPSAAWRLET